MRVMFLIISLLLILFFIGLFTISHHGPDFDNYIEWEQAFITNDIFNIHSTSCSPFGLPVLQWSHGPGLIFALPNMLLPFINAQRSAKIIVWLFCIIFWLTMIAIFGKVTGNNIKLIIFGLLLAFLGTPLGFYSSSYASEILSYCLVAGLLYFSLVLIYEKLKIYYVLGIGVLAALLVIVRFQHVVYLIIPFTAIIIKTILVNKKRKFNVLLLILPFIFLAFGLLQVFSVNRWMTGSFYISPYIFGNTVFKSMDYLKPELSAVLFHSLHGLFPYHPLYVLCFLILIIRLIKAQTWIERYVLLTIIAIVILNIYTYSAWYVWWLGMDTFGMRGLSPLSVLLIPVFINYIKNKGENTTQAKIWLILSLLTSIWSYFLLVQNNTHFYTYQDLLSTQVFTFFKFIKNNILWLILYFGLFIIIILRQRFKQTSGVLLYVTYSLGFLTLLYFKEQISLKYHDLNLTLIYLLVFLVMTLFFFKLHKFYIIPDKELPIRQYRIYFLVFMASLMITTSYLFWKFSYKVESIINTQRLPTRKYTYTYPASVQEIKYSYWEYIKIPGFMDKKEALRIFLTEITHERF